MLKDKWYRINLAVGLGCILLAGLFVLGDLYIPPHNKIKEYIRTGGLFLVGILIILNQPIKASKDDNE